MKMTDLRRRVEKFVKTYPTPLAAGLTVLLILVLIWRYIRWQAVRINGLSPRWTIWRN